MIEKLQKKQYEFVSRPYKKPELSPLPVYESLKPIERHILPVLKKSDYESFSVLPNTFGRESSETIISELKNVLAASRESTSSLEQENTSRSVKNLMIKDLSSRQLERFDTRKKDFGISFFEPTRESIDSIQRIYKNATNSFRDVLKSRKSEKNSSNRKRF